MIAILAPILQLVVAYAIGWICWRMTSPEGGAR